MLNALAGSAKPIPLNELSRLAGMPPSKARRYLISFLDCGLAEQNSISGHYDLGPMALRLGLAALSRIDPVRASVEAAAALSRQIDRTLLVSVWSERGPVIIAWFDSTEILACNLRVGSVLPIANSASGNLFLTYLPRKTTRHLVDRWTRQVTAGGRMSRNEAREELERIVETVRRRGVGTTEESLLPGLSAIAAPVFDSNGSIIAAIAEIHKAQDATIDPRMLGQLLVQTANEVSAKVGYQWQASQDG
ncbi:MAG: IclR family transcriptional regulator [Alphaproteobacteria bacterium]|nr:IclR family transcriptional regulator [Alphaproteobacteria bacterium]